MTDKELLEAAAKAAGYSLKWGEIHIIGDAEVDCTDLPYVISGKPDESDWFWDPLTDDGDALRLAVKLGIVCSSGLHPMYVNDKDTMQAWAMPDKETNIYAGETWSKKRGDPYAATRRAIVRAAASMVKEQP
jgi:hypothetical protein